MKENSRSSRFVCKVSSAFNQPLLIRSGAVRLALVLAAGFVLSATSAGAGTAVWTAGGGADTNWSTAANWTGGTGTAGVAGSLDNVVFNSVGTATSVAGISNVVDSTGGNFAGTIS